MQASPPTPSAADPSVEDADWFLGASPSLGRKGSHALRLLFPLSLNSSQRHKLPFMKSVLMSSQVSNPAKRGLLALRPHGFLELHH